MIHYQELLMRMREVRVRECLKVGKPDMEMETALSASGGYAVSQLRWPKGVVTLLKSVATF